ADRAVAQALLRSRLEKIEELRVRDERLQGVEELLDRLFLKFPPGRSGKEAEEIHDLILRVGEALNEDADEFHTGRLNVALVRLLPQAHDLAQELLPTDGPDHPKEREEVLRLQRRLAISHGNPPPRAEGAPKGSLMQHRPTSLPTAPHRRGGSPRRRWP